MILKSALSISLVASLAACGAPVESDAIARDHEELESEGELTELEWGELEQPITSQATSNTRISGFRVECGNDGAACFVGQSPDCTCLVPLSKTVTFGIASLNNVSFLRTRTEQIVDILNSKYSGAGWSFQVLPEGQDGDVTILNDALPGFSSTDIRTFSNLRCNGTPTLSEGTSINGTFRGIGGCLLQIDVGKIAELIAANLPGASTANPRVTRHALMHQMVKLIGLGATPDSGDAATGPGISFSAEKTGTLPGQDCLVNNYDPSDSTEILLSTSASCGAI